MDWSEFLVRIIAIISAHLLRNLQTMGFMGGRDELNLACFYKERFCYVSCFMNIERSVPIKMNY